MKGHLKKENGKTLGLETINDVHLENLFRAILNIRDEYYKYSLEQLEGSDEYQEQLERVFAYELYHQWSIIQENYNKSVSKEHCRVINGEAGKKLNGCHIYPDMLLHGGQEDIENQEIAIEIKRKVGINKHNVIEDLTKLTRLLSADGLAYGAKAFKKCVFILSGGNESDLKDLLANNSNISIDDNIVCVFCSHHGELDYVSIKKIRES